MISSLISAALPFARPQRLHRAIDRRQSQAGLPQGNRVNAKGDKARNP
jgi:hypothetical protein